MSEYKIGEEVLVKATVIHEYANNYMLEVHGTAQILAKEDNIVSYSQKTYEDGLSDAWGIARKIAVDESDGGFSRDEMVQIFGSFCVADVFENHTATEATEKIKAWETEKEIHVGDVVKVKKIDVGDIFRTKATGFDGVVSGVNEKKCYVILKDGSCGSADKEEIIKTGRTVDVYSLLAEIKEEE